MTDAASTIRTMFSPRALALRAAIVGGVIGASVLWPLMHGARLPSVADLHLRLHAPRWEILAAAPAVIRLHVAAAVSAFLIGSALLAGVKGSGLHKALGWTWCVAMGVTAVSSLFIRTINPGHWSFIHFLSGWVIIAVPMGVAAIKRRDVRAHRRMMTGLFVGGLVVAGAFTFVPGRMMWAVFFG
jgi:uncharacterized membrane protein